MQENKLTKSYKYAPINLNRANASLMIISFLHQTSSKLHNGPKSHNSRKVDSSLQGRFHNLEFPHELDRMSRRQLDSW